MEAQDGTVVGRSVLVENHVCTFDLFCDGNSKEPTLRDLKLCTHCRFPGHRKEECVEKEKVKRELNYLVRSELRADSSNSWGQVWSQHSWKLAGSCTKCGEKDHLRSDCRKRQKCRRCGSRDHDSSFTLSCPTVGRAFAMLKRAHWLDNFLEREATVADLYDYVDWLNNDSQSEEKIGLFPVEEEKHEHDESCNHGHQQQTELPPKENANRPVKRKNALPEEVEVVSGGLGTNEEEKTDPEESGKKVGKNSEKKPDKKNPPKKKKKKSRAKGWSQTKKRRKFVPLKPLRDLGNSNKEDRAILELFSKNSTPPPAGDSQAPSGILHKDGRVVPVGTPMDTTTEDSLPAGEPTGSPTTRPTGSQ